jgi:hypothetical protein
MQILWQTLVTLSSRRLNKLKSGFKLSVIAEPSNVTATLAVGNLLPVWNELLLCRQPAVATRSMSSKYRSSRQG